MSISSVNEFELYDIFIVNSPIIVASIFTSLSFIYQNWTGLIYLFWLVIMSIFRRFIITPTNDKCKNIKTFGSGFSTFVFAFTFGYVFLPMFFYNDINVPLLIGYIIYFLFDIGIKIKDKCIDYKIIGIDLLSGSILGFGICAFIMFGLQMRQLLFFNEISSSKEMCTIKNKKAFKCTVAK